MIVQCDGLRKNALKNRKRRLRLKLNKKRSRAESKVRVDSASMEEESSSDCGYIVNPFTERSSTDRASVTECDNSMDTHQDSTSASDTGVQGGDALPSSPTRTVNNCHRAGVDAFMTGFSYAVFAIQLEENKTQLKSLSNKLYLSGKIVPLQVTRGNFGKLSQAHLNRSKSDTNESAEAFENP